MAMGRYLRVWPAQGRSFRPGMRRPGRPRKTYTKSVPKMVNVAVKRALSKAIERKRHVGSFNTTTASVGNGFHQTFMTTYPLNGIVQGTAQNQRIGQTIKLGKLRATFVFQNTSANDKYHTKYRIIGFWSDEKTESDGSAVGPSECDFTVFTQTTLMVPNTWTSERINGKLNLKDGRIDKLVYDKTFSLQLPNDSAPVGTKTCNINIDFKGKEVTLGADNWFRDKQFYLVIIPYVGGGTNGTTSLPFFEYNQYLTFTDA